MRSACRPGASRRGVHGRADRSIALSLLDTRNVLARPPVDTRRHSLGTATPAAPTGPRAPRPPILSRPPPPAPLKLQWPVGAGIFAGASWVAAFALPSWTITSGIVRFPAARRACRARGGRLIRGLGGVRSGS
jgi:hypothetical protein